MLVSRRNKVSSDIASDSWAGWWERERGWVGKTSFVQVQSHIAARADCEAPMTV